MAEASRGCCPCWTRRGESAERVETEFGGLGAAGTGGSTKDGLALLLRGCQVLEAASDLPSGFLELLADVRVGVGRLEGQLAEKGKRAAMVLPWTKPSSEDDRTWKDLCSSGGPLLRTQACMAAVDDSEEWLVGRLFVSEVGVLFDGSGDIGTDDRGLETGLISWTDVVQWAEKHGPTSSSGLAEVTLTLRDAKLFAQLRLQQQNDLDCKCLHEVWRLCREGGAAGASGSFNSAGADMAFGFHGPEEGGSFHSLTSQQSRGSGSPGSQERPVRSQPTGSVLQVVETMPTPADMKRMPPTVAGTLQGVSLKQVGKLMEKDHGNVLEVFMKTRLKVVDYEAPPWSKGARLSGLVRRVRYKVPIPDDTPKAMQKMLGLPSLIESSVVHRLHLSEKEVSFVAQGVSLNVPHGEAQLVQDVVVFTPIDENRIQVSKWVQVILLKNPPFYMKAALGFVEKRAKTMARENFPFYLAGFGGTAKVDP